MSVDRMSFGSIVMLCLLCSIWGGDERIAIVSVPSEAILRPEAEEIVRLAESAETEHQELNMVYTFSEESSPTAIADRPPQEEVLTSFERLVQYLESLCGHEQNPEAP